MNESLIKKEPWNIVGIEIEYTDVIAQRIDPLQDFLHNKDFQIVNGEVNKKLINFR